MTENGAARTEATAAGAPVQNGIMQQGALALRPVAFAFRAVSLVLIAVGIVRITGIFGPDPSLSAFTFYTVLSNVLCLGWMLVLVVATSRDLVLRGPHGVSSPSASWSAAIMMAITITMLVYLVVLVPTSFVQGSDYVPFSLTDNLIHIVTPCLLIVDWLLFVPKGALRRADPVRWLGFPLVYLVFAFIYGGLGGEFSPGQRYPYPFLNVEAHGVGGVALWVVGLGIALTAVGYLYFWLDRALAGRVRNSDASRRSELGSESVG
ncbi:Pr6Pr family membrane protein [Leucobacter aridicollis]|uniref:Pr6Pr family membrane protein n=1 Tax=Leucobacter aridicollis TaxID=283878 RepID=UPI0021038856|nr:Pr6Pr family membrane protein [Leucobacter aridicollis]UTX54408.1 Pr6Pr family membrane protein [Leucobacter aridicollis]